MTLSSLNCFYTFVKNKMAIFVEVKQEEERGENRKDKHSGNV